MPVALPMNTGVIVYVAFKGVINDTDEYVALRLEDKDAKSSLHNVVIAPHRRLRGCFDGAIFQDGTIAKVSAHAPVWVSFKVWRDKKGEVRYRITDSISKVIDTVANAKKIYENTFNHENLDYSKVYLKQNLPGAELERWWESAMKDFRENLDWKQVFESKEQKILREKLAKEL